jgi:molybdopterin/thiamine biosynthesis adenylyltransferase
METASSRPVGCGYMRIDCRLPDFLMRDIRNMLTNKDKNRYQRQLLIPEIGSVGQQKLRQAKVLIAGAGGLGSPVAFYLAAAGIGRMRLIDHDRVELSNLNRQILHGESNVGQSKVDSAAGKLNQLNPAVTIDCIKEPLTDENALRLIQGFDLIVDAMDNWPTRLILNKIALALNIPLFHGAVNGFEGQVTTVIPGLTACLACARRGDVPQKTASVIGVAPAVIGGLQATEVIKFIIGAGQLLTNRLLRYDGLALKFTEFNTRRNPACPQCGRRPEKE